MGENSAYKSQFCCTIFDNVCKKPNNIDRYDWGEAEDQKHCRI